MKFEKLAHGKQCYLRFPGICNGNPETVVPCHIRLGHIGGMGFETSTDLYRTWLHELPFGTRC